MPSRVKVGRGGGELRGERREGSGEMIEGGTGRGGRSAQDAPSVGRAREDNALEQCLDELWGGTNAFTQF